MTSPAPEKAAPIPADAIYATARGILGNPALCHQGVEAMVDAAVRAGIKLASDRASQEERIREDEFPRLSDRIVQAAAEAHYGKRRVDENGGVDAISMTVDDRDFSFRQMMRRMWPAIRKAAAADRARLRGGSS